MTDMHPGSAGGDSTTDDPDQGRDWHKSQELSVPADGLTNINQSTQQWTLPDLMKAYGRALSESAPRAFPEPKPLEKQYMMEVLHKSQADISNGFQMSPAQFSQFRKWQSFGLRDRLGGLSNWLEKSK
jgi:hypothetical protein